MLTGATAEKYRAIREQQINFQRNRGILLPKRDVPVLPEWDAEIQRYIEKQNEAKSAASAAEE